MKTLRTASLLLAILGFAPLATHAQTSSTVPFGYQQITVPAAADLLNPSSTVIAVPFYNTSVYIGAITSVDGPNSLSTSSANFADNYAASPYFVHLKSGANAGRYFLIVSNTTTQLTVAPKGYDLTAILAVGDTYEIIPANTLASLFGTGTGSVPFQTGASATQSDNVLLWNVNKWDVFYNNGTNWKKSGSLANQNGTILYPDEGIYITRRAFTPVTLTFAGTASSGVERSDLAGPGSTFVANRFPVDITLNSLSIQNLPGWLKGASASQADNVYLWSGNTWGVYYHNGTNWKRSGSLSNVNTQVIPAGTAAFVIRQSNASGAASTLVQTSPQ